MNRPDTLCTPLSDHYAYIRRKRLLEIVPFSAATLHRLIRAKKFPAQRKLSDRVSVWSVAEVHAWLDSKGGVK